MKQVIVLLVFVLVLSVPVVTVQANSDVCPEGNGWIKVDGLSGYSFTYTAPQGQLVTESCYKASNAEPTYTTYQPPKEEVTITSDVINEGGQRAQLSHASFRLVQETPVVTEETPVVTEETPVVTEETPVVTEETPVVTEETPVVTEETPQPTEEPENISLEGIYSVSVQSSVINDWYKSFFKELRVEECEEPCTAEQIEAQLEESNVWVAVQQGRVLYTHSGWSIVSGPEFGEILLRVNNSNDLKQTIICLDEKRCYKIADFVVLGRGSVGGNISTEKLFSIEHGDYFIVTCADRLFPGVKTPKLILQLRLIE